MNGGADGAAMAGEEIADGEAIGAGVVTDGAAMAGAAAIGGATEAGEMTVGVIAATTAEAGTIRGSISASACLAPALSTTIIIARAPCTVRRAHPDTCSGVTRVTVRTGPGTTPSSPITDRAGNAYRLTATKTQVYQMTEPARPPAAPALAPPPGAPRGTGRIGTELLAPRDLRTWPPRHIHFWMLHLPTNDKRPSCQLKPCRNGT
jgi:hypothetical protein